MDETREARAKRALALVLGGLALPFVMAVIQAADALAPESLSVRGTRAALAIGLENPSRPAPSPTRARAAYTPSPAVRALVEQVRNETVPAEGQATDYGMAFDGRSYDALVAAYPKLPVNPRWAVAYEQLDVTLPCCPTEHPVADETKNCGCGHHQSLYALAKQLLAQGRSTQQVQQELHRWAAYFFPKETIMAELQRRSVSDPAVAQVLTERRTKGGC